MTKIYFAGSENEQFNQLLHRTNQKYVLVSFYYISRKKTSIERLTSFKEVILDSGAFSFRLDTNTGKVASKEYFLKLFEKYKAFLLQYGHLFKEIYELDVDEQVGIEQVDKWYEELKKIHPKVIRVFHKSMGKERLDLYLNQCKKIAIPGREYKFSYKKLKRMVDYIHSKNVEVHGLAVTTSNIIKKCGFDSVDSTSWLTGARYGIFFIFNKQDLIGLNTQQFHRKYGKAFNKLSYQKINYWNVLQWKKFADYMEGYKHYENTNTV